MTEGSNVGVIRRIVPTHVAYSESWETILPYNGVELSVRISRCRRFGFRKFTSSFHCQSAWVPTGQVRSGVEVYSRKIFEKIFIGENFCGQLDFAICAMCFDSEKKLKTAKHDSVNQAMIRD